ncbi:MAG: hypothetical protein GXY34_12205 [Syntrophomonadaceae bacterium]|nr:hypothetical protein [Syntrophomonadaceae bacterium]
MTLDISRYKALVFLLFILLLITALPGCSSEKNSSPQGKKPLSKKQEPKWYIQFSVKDQRSTAYTEEAGAPLASNGQPYFLGGIAVHPRYPLQYGGDPRVPLLPYGTVIYPNKPIKIQGDYYNALTVMDTGDVNYGLWENHPYWFDVYYGSGNYWANQAAREYGTPLTSYSWYEEWQ